MKRDKVIEQQQNNHQAFIEYINSLTDEEFLVSHHAKWTAGQQLQHICLSVRPVNLALLLPTFILRLYVYTTLTRLNRPFYIFYPYFQL